MNALALLLLAPLADVVLAGINFETTCDFETFTEGDVITEVCASQCFGDAGIPGCFSAFAIEGFRGEQGRARNYPMPLTELPVNATNVLTIFDSSCRNSSGLPSNLTCSGEDPDLFQIDFGNTLIIQEFFDKDDDPTDGSVADPDDNRRGGCIWFNFQGGSPQFGFGGVASVLSIDFLDVEPPEFNPLTIRCTNVNGSVLEVANVANGITGNGRSGVVNTMAECTDARVLEVCLPGSGAIDGLKLTVNTEEACPPFNEEVVDDPDWCDWHGRTCADIASWAPHEIAWKCRRSHVRRNCPATCCKPPKEICITEEPECGYDDPDYKGDVCFWHDYTCADIATDLFKNYLCRKMPGAKDACGETCCSEAVYA